MSNTLAPFCDDDPEIRKVKTVASNTLLRAPLLVELLSYYSMWPRSLKAIIWLMRFKHFTVSKYGHKDRVSSPPTTYLAVRETDEALLAVAKLVLGQVLIDALRTLKDSETLTNVTLKGSNLGKSAPSGLRTAARLNQWCFAGRKGSAEFRFAV